MTAHLAGCRCHDCWLARSEAAAVRVAARCEPAVRSSAPTETGVKDALRRLPGAGVPATGQRPAQTEAQFQSAVTEYAALRGWTWYHTHRSDRSPAGFPDLVLVRRDRLLFVELKSEKGRLSTAQVEWLCALRETAAAVYCWRPSSWDEVLTVLA